MKILLVRPDMKGVQVPPPYAPLGLLYIAAYLEKNGKGYSVRIVDLNLEPESVLQQELPDSDIVGFSMLPVVRSRPFALIREIKEAYPYKKVVLGGPFASSLSSFLLEKLPIDAIVFGEGESALMSYCLDYEGDLLKGKQKFVGTLSNLDSLPFPAWEKTNLDLWTMQIAKSRPSIEANGVRIGGAKWVPIIASRGCYGRCLFCDSYSHWGYKVRVRSAENIVSEIEELNKMGVTLLSFDDDAFPYDRNQCMELCSLIKSKGIKVAWKADTRADVFDKEMLIAMKEAGCFMLAVGIESGSPKILRTIRKGLNLDVAAQAIRDMNDVGILSYALLMIGNPGESDDTMRETVAFMNSCKPSLFSYVKGVMVVPGTKMQELQGIPNEYYLTGDGLPIYDKEHTQEDLGRFETILRTGYQRE